MQLAKLQYLGADPVISTGVFFSLTVLLRAQLLALSPAALALLALRAPLLETLSVGLACVTPALLGIAHAGGLAHLRELTVVGCGVRAAAAQRAVG
jgi:hypothetical protein